MSQHNSAAESDGDSEPDFRDSNSSASDSENEMDAPAARDVKLVTQDDDVTSTTSKSPENLELLGRTRSGRVYTSPTSKGKGTQAYHPQAQGSYASSSQSKRQSSSSLKTVANGNRDRLPKTEPANNEDEICQEPEGFAHVHATVPDPVKHIKQKGSCSISKMVGNFFTENKGLLALIVGIIAIGIVVNINYQTSPAITPNHRLPYFEANFEKLNKKYDMGLGHQYSATINHIRAAIESSLEEAEPKFPSTMVILLPPEAELSGTTCYLKELGKIVNQAFNSTLPAKILNSKYFEKAYKDIHGIHKDLKNYFNQSGKVVIVHDIAQLQVLEHLLVFHAFCDDFLAPEPRAIYFFPISITGEAYEKRQWKPKQALALTDLILTKAWSKTLTPDTINPLIARVARSAVMIKDPIKCKIW